MKQDLEFLEIARISNQTRIYGVFSNVLTGLNGNDWLEFPKVLIVTVCSNNIKESPV